jgi:hypothetical protein
MNKTILLLSLFLANSQAHALSLFEKGSDVRSAYETLKSLYEQSSNPISPDIFGEFNEPNQNIRLCAIASKEKRGLQNISTFVNYNFIVEKAELGHGPLFPGQSDITKRILVDEASAKRFPLNLSDGVRDPVQYIRGADFIQSNRFAFRSGLYSIYFRMNGDYVVGTYSDSFLSVKHGDSYFYCWKVE